VTLPGFHVAGHGRVVFRSEKVGTRLVGISLVIIFSGFVGVGEVDSGNPAVFLVGAFVTCPTNKVK